METNFYRKVKQGLKKVEGQKIAAPMDPSAPKKIGNQVDFMTENVPLPFTI
jgi:hypothetical protein